jgi:5-methylcytosine-specific restriction enzyme subunit McrC
MHRLLYISEQHQAKKLENVSDYLKSVLTGNDYLKPFYHRPEMHCFRLFRKDNEFLADSNYFIGTDWLITEHASIYIEPKLNNNVQVDFLGMLLQSLETSENLEHLEGLFHIEFDKPWITIPSQKDILSPILIIQFLKLLQKIVRKGLKKSYYRVTENLNSRVKGKILIGQQVKTNIVKNKLTKTICNYQEYGINTEENKFLKLVLNFASSYIYQNPIIFGKDCSTIKNILQYCLPSFEQINILKNKHQRIHQTKNPFYKEYEEAIRIGNYILKRFSFNINKTMQTSAITPPFWIDMSKLFELYVYGKLKKIFPDPNSITYLDKFLGSKETDILVRVENYKCVIDCKYKPQYKDHDPSLEDKRQLAGYTRLRSVYKKLDVKESENIKGVIIYSHQDCNDSIQKADLFKTPIQEYVDFFKVGIKLPELKGDL